MCFVPHARECIPVGRSLFRRALPKNRWHYLHVRTYFERGLGKRVCTRTRNDGIIYKSETKKSVKPKRCCTKQIQYMYSCNTILNVCGRRVACCMRVQTHACCLFIILEVVYSLFVGLAQLSVLCALRTFLNQMRAQNTIFYTQPERERERVEGLI